MKGLYQIIRTHSQKSLSNHTGRLQQQNISLHRTSPLHLSSILILHEQQIQNIAAGWEDGKQVEQLIVEREVLPIGAMQIQEIAIAGDEGVHTIASVTEIDVTEQVTFHIARQQPHILRANRKTLWQVAFVVPIKKFEKASSVEELLIPHEL